MTDPEDETQPLMLTAQTHVDAGRARAFEVGLTPEPVVEQFAEFLRRAYYLHAGRSSFGIWRTPLAMLDPSAGAGVFGRVFGRVFPELRRVVGVEARPEEAPNLRRNYTQHLVARFEAALPELRGMFPVPEEPDPYVDDPIDPDARTGFDLIATNPPFSLIAPDADGRSWLDDLLSLLDDRGWLFLLLPSDTFQRKDHEWPWLIEKGTHRVPRVVYRIPGRIAFLGGSSTDHRTYSWFGWEQGRSFTAPQSWQTFTLPPLPPAAKRWRTRPGEAG